MNEAQEPERQARERQFAEVLVELARTLPATNEELDREEPAGELSLRLAGAIIGTRRRSHSSAYARGKPTVYAPLFDALGDDGLPDVDGLYEACAYADGLYDAEIAELTAEAIIHHLSPGMVGDGSGG